MLLQEIRKSTYENSTEEKTNVIEKHVNDLSKWNLKVDEESKNIPRMYWTPKIHKTPIGTRFIIGNPRSTLKPLTKDITQICKRFLEALTLYYNKVDFMSGTKHLWITQNNNQFIEFMDRTNRKGKAKSISTYDFSSLYTHIPHDQLITVLSELVDFVFQGGTRTYISVTKSGANFVQKQNRKKTCYTKESIKEAIIYIMENCYFTIGNMTFRQIIGIPMGSDPAPFFANFFLSHFEAKYISQLRKRDPKLARKFKNICRYIDDLVAPNDDNAFHNSFLEIYPAELTLNKENEVNTAATFLDLDIEIIDNKFVTKIFDKRDSYEFDIVRLPHKSSNIPYKMFYNTLGAEFLRVCRATSNYQPFKSSSISLIRRVKRQGGCVKGIESLLKKTINKHWLTFSKFEVNQTIMIKDILL